MTKFKITVKITRTFVRVLEEIASHERDTIRIRLFGGRREVHLVNALYRPRVAHTL